MHSDYRHCRKFMKTTATNRTRPNAGTQTDILTETPTEMVRAFRESILSGNIRYPFDEGVTARQREDYTRKLRTLAGGDTVS